MTAFTVRVSDATAAKLDELAQKLDRPRSAVAARAIEDFVEREAWQLAEIEAGRAEAESGNFASSAELAQVIAKYVERHRSRSTRRSMTSRDASPSSFIMSRTSRNT